MAGDQNACNTSFEIDLIVSALVVGLTSKDDWFLFVNLCQGINDRSAEFDLDIGVVELLLVKLVSDNDRAIGIKALGLQFEVSGGKAIE